MTDLPARRYRRGERGLESAERRMLASAKMRRLLKKLESEFTVPFVVPTFRPVYIDKRMNGSVLGRFFGPHIKIAGSHAYENSKKYVLHTLWHEILHGVVSDNAKALELTGKFNMHTAHSALERAVFRLGEGLGLHDSHEYEINTECGCWLKSIKRRNVFRCNHGLTHVSPTEYRKLTRIVAVKSKIISINISNYRVWKSNHRRP